MRNVFFDFYDSVKRYTSLYPGEFRSSVIAILIISFAISFRNWGVGSQPDISVGLVNFLGAIIIVAISFFGRTYVQKLFALGGDLRAEFKLWSTGILLTLIIAFVSNGKIWFLIPGGATIHVLAGKRIGWFRYGPNYFGIGAAAMGGPFGNIILAMIFRALYSLTHIQLFWTAFLLNIVWALWQSVPFPPADGGRMFYGSRLAYMWMLAVIVTASALLYSQMNVFLTIILSVLAGWVWWIIYYIVWERFLFKGNYG